MKGQTERADSFLMKHVGINYKKFIKQYEGGKFGKGESQNKILFYLSALESLESRGFDLENFLDTIKDSTSPLMVPLENDIVNSNIKRTLGKYSTVGDRNFDLTTLVSREILNEMHDGNTDCKILTGKKYHDSKSGILFDVLLNVEDLKNLEKINQRDSPVVPYFSYGTIKNPQEYFLSLNKKFPSITKVFRGSEGSNPVLFKLENKTFTLRSYIALNGNIKSAL